MLGYCEVYSGDLEELDDDRVFVERYWAKDQTWDQATLDELWNKYRIWYDGQNPPVKIIARQNRNTAFAIGDEDDGCITFDLGLDGRYLAVTTLQSIIDLLPVISRLV